MLYFTYDDRMHKIFQKVMQKIRLHNFASRFFFEMHNFTYTLILKLNNLFSLKIYNL